MSQSESAQIQQTNNTIP